MSHSLNLWHPCSLSQRHVPYTVKLRSLSMSWDPSLSWRTTVLKALAKLFMKQSTPDVTVVVPIHNKEKYLGQCLASVLTQERVELEVICIDDASTDRSLEVVAQFEQDGRVRLVRNTTNIGAGRSRNIGIQSARGCYLQFTDADDLLPPNSLIRLLSAAKRTEAEVVQGRVQMFRGEVVLGSEALHITERVGSFEAFPDLWVPWFHVSFLISRQLLRRSGALYPSLRTGEDPVFMAKVLTSASRICCSNQQITYLYRLDDERKRQSAVTPLHVADYIEHAQLVKEIYGEKNAKAWAAYREFIIPDIRLLLSRAHCNHETIRDLEERIAALCRR
jgi:glycosyltransferase involved in cell wall biosynthesis